MRLARYVLMSAILCLVASTNTHAQLSGMLSPSKLTVSSRNIFHIQMTATDTIPANTIVHLQCPGGMQNLIWPIATNIHMSTSGASGIQIQSILSAQVLRPPVWDNDMLPAIISARIKNQPVLPGETIDVTLGNPGLTGAFMIRTITTVGKLEFRVALEDSGGHWTEVLRLPFWHESSIPDNVFAVLPSIVATGETGNSLFGITGTTGVPFSKASFTFLVLIPAWIFQTNSSSRMRIQDTSKSPSNSQQKDSIA